MKSRELRHLGYKRRFIVFLVLFIVTFFSLAAVVYCNFDYLVFKTLMTTSYSYTDALDEIYSTQLRLDDDDAIDYYKNFDDVVIGVMTNHVGAVANDGYTYLYTPEEYVLAGETTKAVADEARVEIIDVDTVYVRIPNVSSYTKDFLYANKEEIAKYSYLMLDLRSNYGGNLDHCYSMANLFLEPGDIIANEITRLFSTRVITASGGKYFDFEQIYILQDGNSASAAETVTLALSENLDNVTIVGEKSFGKGIGQVTLDLKYGYAVKATTLLLTSPSGISIHKKGIEPDIACSSDDALSEALLAISGR